MTRMLYDGSFEGVLTAVFEVYERKLTNVNLQRGEHLSTAMFEEVLFVDTDNARATRVLNGLKQKLSPMGIQRLYVAHLAAIENEDNNILGFIRYVFDTPKNVEDDYGNRYVLRVSNIVGMMRRERHRMQAFIRFKKLRDEIYYAAIEPDFNVLPLLIKHFKDRYADQKWIIYDIKRHYGLYYDLHEVEYISFEFADGHTADKVGDALFNDEETYQHLWKNYFHSVNIASRKNTKLHVRHIPKRYWKHLTEKI